ncbi:MAG: hypothetical protein WCK00_11015, partial [Deltaproteobacteria bacterium]
TNYQQDNPLIGIMSPDYPLLAEPARTTTLSLPAFAAKNLGLSKIYYFHNTLYGRAWLDPQRHLRPEAIEEFARRDPDTRLIIVGDAAMAPYELVGANGSLYVGQKGSQSGEARLKFLARTFRHAVWLNPQEEAGWGYTWTIEAIGKIFPMFELTLDGLERAVQHLMKRN